MIYRFLIITCLVLLTPSIAQSKEIKYNHNSIRINQVIKRVHYRVYVPQNIPRDWTLEIKTYPTQSSKIRDFSLHYMNNDDTKMMVAIHEKKLTRDAFPPNPASFVKIKIKDRVLLFKGFANYSNGGTIFIALNGTYIEMLSFKLSKDQMVYIASSLK
jgi:hypothetical protein